MPWRKRCINSETTQGGRVLAQWIIEDAYGIEVLRFFYITPDTEQTVDFVLMSAGEAVKEGSLSREVVAE